jgi:Holliday junction resolvase RusA-like endonuclease
MDIAFEVVGTPKPAGSKRAMPIYRGTGEGREFTGKAAVVDSSGQAGKDWRTDVAYAARAAMGNRPPMHGPLGMSVVFKFNRPKWHYRTGKYAGELREAAPEHHTQAPDTTKLVRGLEDAMTGIVAVDDCLFVEQHAQKVWAESGEKPGAVVRVWRAES